MTEKQNLHSLMMNIDQMNGCHQDPALPTTVPPSGLIWRSAKIADISSQRPMTIIRLIEPRGFAVPKGYGQP
jgi:hypothetical protein